MPSILDFDLLSDDRLAGFANASLGPTAEPLTAVALAHLVSAPGFDELWQECLKRALALALKTYDETVDEALRTLTADRRFQLYVKKALAATRRNDSGRTQTAALKQLTELVATGARQSPHWWLAGTLLTGVLTGGLLIKFTGSVDLKIPDKKIPLDSAEVSRAADRIIEANKEYLIQIQDTAKLQV